MLEWEKWSFSEAIQKGGSFPRLTNLTLVNCPKLKVGLPGYLPSLKSPRINNCENMVFLLPRTQQRVSVFPSLVSVRVLSCPALESLLDWGYDSKLKELCLWNCRTLFEKSMNWDLLQSLSCLEYLNISDWEDDLFPSAKWLLLTSVTQIIIRNCRNLKGLNGNALQQLTSLTSLSIFGCYSLRCLPEEGLPASLSSLAISRCPLLTQRCQKDGEDWPKISHVASVSVDYKQIN